MGNSPPNFRLVKYYNSPSRSVSMHAVVCPPPGAFALLNLAGRGEKPRSPSSALEPFFGWEGSPTKIDNREKGTLILTSPLEDLEAERGLCKKKRSHQSDGVFPWASP